MLCNIILCIVLNYDIYSKLSAENSSQSFCVGWAVFYEDYFIIFIISDHRANLGGSVLGVDIDSSPWQQ